MAFYELNAAELDIVSAGKRGPTVRTARNVYAKQGIVNVQVAVAIANGGDATATNQAVNTNNASADNL